MIGASALSAGRRMAASRHTETLTFFSSVTGTDPDTLQGVDIETVIYSGIKGRVKYPSLTVSSSTAVGQTFASQDVTVNVGVGATPNVRADHFCRVTASTADADFVGRKFRVKGSAQSGQVTEHRYPVEEKS